MRVVIVGCGRVGAGLATGLADAGDRVTVIDKDPKAFERLGEDFAGQTVEGIGFDRDVLELAGIASADALVAVTSGDNSNVVAARVARDAYRVPRVIARIHDPRRAALYEELGIVTVSSTDWAMRKVRDYLEHRTLKEETAFGRGEVSLLRLELPQHLVDRSVADLEEGGGLRVVSITRRGGAFVPDPTTVLVEADVVRVSVAADARDRLDALLAEEAGREAAGREVTTWESWSRGRGCGAPISPTTSSAKATRSWWWSRTPPPPAGRGRPAAASWSPGTPASRRCSTGSAWTRSTRWSRPPGTTRTTWS